MKILSTERIQLRWLSDDDSDFIIALLNDPAFIRNIADRGVRNTEDALKYIKKMRDNYHSQGYGFFLVESFQGEKMGIAGIIHREGLSHPDIGFAFLPQYCGKGFAYESSHALKNMAELEWGMNKILAIVSPGNTPSQKLLVKLGLRFDKLIRLTEKDDEVELFVWEKS